MQDFVVYSHPLVLGRLGIRLETLKVSLKVTFDGPTGSRDGDDGDGDDDDYYDDDLEVSLKMTFDEEVVQLQRARDIPGTLQQSFRATHGS